MLNGHILLRAQLSLPLRGSGTPEAEQATAAAHLGLTLLQPTRQVNNLSINQSISVRFESASCAHKLTNGAGQLGFQAGLNLHDNCMSADSVVVIIHYTEYGSQMLEGIS